MLPPTLPLLARFARTRLVAMLAILVVSVSAAACGTTIFNTLRTGNEFVLVHNMYIDADTTVTFCLDTAGKRVDWYFVPLQAAQVWTERAIAHYQTTSAVFTTQPTPVVASKIGTTGFSDFVTVVPKTIAEAANGNFVVLIHVTTDCTDTGNSCRVGSSTTNVGFSVILMAVLIAIGVLLCICISTLVFCCCRRRRRIRKEEEAAAAAAAAKQQSTSTQPDYVSPPEQEQQQRLQQQRGQHVVVNVHEQSAAASFAQQPPSRPVSPGVRSAPPTYGTPPPTYGVSTPPMGYPAYPHQHHQQQYHPYPPVQGYGGGVMGGYPAAYGYPAPSPGAASQPTPAVPPITSFELANHSHHATPGATSVESTPRGGYPPLAAAGATGVASGTATPARRRSPPRTAVIQNTAEHHRSAPGSNQPSPARSPNHHGIGGDQPQYIVMWDPSTGVNPHHNRSPRQQPRV